MLGFFRLANDVPGYEEMEFRRPEPKVDAGGVAGRNGDDNPNGEGKVIDVGLETGQDSQGGIFQPNGDGNAERQSGWVEEVKEDEEGKLEKND